MRETGRQTERTSKRGQEKRIVITLLRCVCVTWLMVERHLEAPGSW